MARKIIDIGAVGNDGTGDSIRDSFRKVNDNFRELYSSLGLGDKLTFRGLDDTPSSYVGQENSFLTVNNTETGLQFKQIKAGTGIQLDTITNPNELAISTLFAEISGDPNPKLGGNLRTRSGAVQYRIIDMGTTGAPLLPLYQHEAVNKFYADTKISRAGVDAVDPRTQSVNPDFGTMTGPLILSRDPQPEDDIVYDGLIAATKRYVDNSAFGSVANLYVATSGADERPGVSPSLQGRALAYAYRTIEAAMKRAEELVNESRVEMGPYKKVLTYAEGQFQCELSSITTSPDSGSGFIGKVFMSADTVTLASRGTNYQVGDLIQLNGGVGVKTTLEVLSTAGNPGGVTTFKIISSGVYEALPGSISVPTTSNSAFGTGAKFDITYKVNNIIVTDSGQDYGLVSVRITNAIGDSTGSGAFGTADVSNGEISGITITDKGTGFTALPTVTVDLPRFKIYTAGLRTDFTGDVNNPSVISNRARDIREGLFLRGETSGALAQILAHQGELDGNDEIFDVDIKYGTFEVGEIISYGDVTKNIQLTVFVESGTYEENFPIKVPQNVALIGDEFRRVLIRPRIGTSSSPWAFQKFRREREFDGLTTATELFGYHYLSDSTQPVFPIVNNKGFYTSTAELVSLNKEFMQEEVIAWIAHKVSTNSAPFNSAFTYDSDLCKRDVGLIVDSIVYDLKYGGFNRTISAALKYKGPVSPLGDPSVAIGIQLPQTVAAINYIDFLAQQVITNTSIDPVYNTLRSQTVDLAYTAETGSGPVITELVSAIVDVISNSNSVNYPKDNDQVDVFLCNDAVILRRVTAQGHGGFMMVLDPAGQILAKSPYAQECASFSKSTGRQRFAGGMFVDGFTGNLQFKIIERVTVNSLLSNTRFRITGLDRFPNLPASFIVNDSVYRINYVRDYVFNPAGSSAQFVIDEITPFTYPVGPQAVAVSLGAPSVFTSASHFLQIGATLVFSSTGTLPAPLIAGKQYYVIATDFGPNSFKITDTPGALTGIEITTSGSGTISFDRVYEVLMPGNRSMLSNDYTQINDMGYGLVVTNGGLTEAVSMFTYYCYISYYSLNGGQIRSIAGSSAHGVYALVAEGSDPLEIPTPVTLFHDMAQGATVYSPAPAYANTAGGLSLYVNNYTYVPLDNGELEVVHSDGNLYRYSVNSVTTADLPAGVAKVNISATGNTASAGLVYVIPDGNKVTIRSNSQVVLTGDVVEVATRPSTALLLNESSEVYRVLQFTAYNDPAPNTTVTVSIANPAVFTTVSAHGLLASYIIRFSSTGTLPTGLSATVSYYIIEGGLTSNQFRVSTSKNGNPIAVTVAGTGTLSYYAYGLARTTLRENYNYIDLTVWQANEYASKSTTATNSYATGSYITLASVLGIQTGMRANFSGTSFGTISNSTQYYTTFVSNTATQTVANVSRTSNTVTVNTGGGAQITASAFATRTGTGPFLVTLCLPTLASTPVVGSFYSVYGNSTSGYNGNFLSTAVTVTGVASLSISATTTTSNLITANSVSGIVVGQPITMSGSLGGLSATTYWVGSIVSTSPILISTVARSSNTATIVTVVSHNLVNNQTVSITGTGLLDQNNVLITVTGANSFTFTSVTTGTILTTSVSGSFATPAPQFTVSPTQTGIVSGSTVTLSTATGSITGTTAAITTITLSYPSNPGTYSNVTPTYVQALTPHGLSSGQLVTVAGTSLVDQANVVVTVASTVQFTYTSSGSGSIAQQSVVATGTTTPAPQISISTALGSSNLAVTNASGTMTGVFTGGPIQCTITVATTTVINATGHGLSIGDAIRFSSVGGSLPTGMNDSRHYFVIATGYTANSFQISLTPGGTVVGTTGSATGTISYGRVKGRVGDSNFAVVPVGPADKARIIGTKLVWVGVEYVITNYQDETITGAAFARLTLDKPLEYSVVSFGSSPALKSAVPKRSAGAAGTLTIRISLTRVTGHDLLEIGTGSYADTNYPNEIYGAAVNPLNAAAETEERGSGRVFYVTTDQFGNFNVGPYFRVDQGTGRVTFAAAIALSNLDGLGFKRGVPIAEFSTDSAMSDNATDTVPTENATRTYVERRLGLSHTGVPITANNLIPAFTGGFLALDGQLPMKGTMDLGNNLISNVANPVAPTDAINLRSLTFSNLQEFSITSLGSADLLAFTGVGNNAINATVTGDITLTLNPSTRQLSAQLVAGTIVNADISASAAIVQSKLTLNAAAGRVNATGITQADRGLASFDSSQFDVTNGWATIKDNGIATSKIAQIAQKSVLGNNSVTTDNITTVSYANIVDGGLAIKKSQYSSGTGILKRVNTGSSVADGDYSLIADDSNNTVSTLVRRDSNGDFASRTVTLQDIKLKLNTDTAGVLTLARVSSATGGSTRVYGWNSNGGVLIGDGTLAADKTTFYDNNAHSFRTQDGFNPAPILASSIQVTAITAGSPTTNATITGRWTLNGAGSRMQATYSADLAEYYEGDKEYEVGTVLVFGGDKEVTIATAKEDHRIAGVVSDTAAYSMYGACPGDKNLIALQGRVPCKVAGKIAKGDLLITSHIPGVAVSAGGNARTGTVVGKALENYDSNHVGTIEVAVGRT
jgi:hypothetical protein